MGLFDRLAEASRRRRETAEEDAIAYIRKLERDRSAERARLDRLAREFVELAQDGCLLEIRSRLGGMHPPESMAVMLRAQALLLDTTKAAQRASPKEWK